MILLVLLFLLNEDTRPHEILQIQREIQILNLINGLELSEYQMEFVLERAKEAEKAREDFYANLKNYEDEALQVFDRLKENRIDDDVISNTLRNDIHATEERLHEYKDGLSESLTEIAQEVEDVLGGNQVYALEHYIACLIPPPGEARIGQSEKPLGFMKQLNRIRDIPDYIYQVKKYEIADKSVEKIKKHLPSGTLFDEYGERTRILLLLDEIRRAEDIDFALKEEEYTERIKGDYFPKKIPVNLTSKIERFLLSPLIMPILEKKLERK